MFRIIDSRPVSPRSDIKNDEAYVDIGKISANKKEKSIDCVEIFTMNMT